MRFVVRSLRERPSQRILLGILALTVLASARPALAADQAAVDPPADRAFDDPTTDVAPEQGATDPSTAEKPYWRRNLFGRFFSDQKYLFTDWIHTEAHRPGFIIPVMIGTGLAVAESRDADASQPDVTFERDFEGDTNGTNRGAAHLFTTLGDAPVGLLMIGSAYLAGRWTGHDRFAATASLSAEAVLDTGLWVTVLKGVTARTRPAGGGTGEFFQYSPPHGQQGGSFPSGHASGAFAAAGVFAQMYKKDHPWVAWAAYGTASLVGASRVALGRHFPTDVVVGAFIGDSFGRMVVARNRGTETQVSSAIVPFYEPAGPAGPEEGVLWHRTW